MIITPHRLLTGSQTGPQQKQQKKSMKTRLCSLKVTDQWLTPVKDDEDGCSKKPEAATPKSWKPLTVPHSHFGDTKLQFSDPVFHGTENSDLGWVLMTTIEHEDEKVLFTSDIQGPIQVSTLNKILAQQPQLVIVGGPPTYLSRTQNKLKKK